MANIVLTDQTFYRSGASGASSVVGYESQKNRVVRYLLNTPASGASSVALNFSGNWQGAGTTPNTLYFYIGTDANSHSNAGYDFEHTGVLTRNNSTYDYAGSAEILLMPNTTYYVWVFPSSAVFGWTYWSRSIGDATIETMGGAVSTVNPASAVLGSEVELYVTKHTENYTHTIRYELANAVGLICEKSYETKILWTPPVELAWEITNSDRANATLFVETYNGDELVGTTSDTQFELIVPESIIPSVSFSWKDLSAASENFNALAQGVSFLDVDVSASGVYGSRIEKVETTLDNEPYNGGIVDKFGDLTLTVSVFDSRGRSASNSKNLYVFRYSTPSISISASRCNIDGTANETGEYATVTIKTVTHQVNNKNEASVLLNYGGGSDTISVSVGEKQTLKIIPAPSVAPLAISAVVYDKIKESPIAKMVLSIGYATLDFLSGGKGIAFGTTATKPGFTCAMDTDFCGRTVTGLPAPSQPEDAATKAYVDEVAQRATPIPMLVGQEYLAEEYWNGRPVYTKMLAFSPKKITSQTVTLPHGIQGLDIGLSVAVLWKHVNASGNVTWRNFPAVYYGTVDWSAQAYFEGADNIKFELGSQVRTNMANSAQDFYVTLRYVKEAL